MVVSIVNRIATFTGTETLTGATSQLEGATQAVIVGYDSIGNNAFHKASALTSITIPASVTSIGNNAFSDATSLATITFANDSQLKTIGNDAFFIQD